MTKIELEFCAKCRGKCCHIYKDKSPEHFEFIQKAFFKKDISQFGVEPLEIVDGRCNFLGENGCIIERSKRPEQCLKYKCDDLKNILETNN